VSEQDEWRFLLAGGTQKPRELPNPAPGWLTDRSWGDILTLAALDTYADFAADFPSHVKKFKEIFDSTDPHRFERICVRIFLVNNNNNNNNNNKQTFQNALLTD